MKKTESPNQQYHNLDLAFEFFNRELFGGELPKPIITLRKSPRTLGWYHAGNFYHRNTAHHIDEICLCANMWPQQDDREILSTLVHEMAHQWQQHKGTPSRKCYHDREWAAKMESIGLMPSATGREGGKKTGQKMDHYIIKGGAYDHAYAVLRDRKTFKLEWQEVKFDKSEAKEKKPTRFKYVCHGCEQAAWAKESANLMCGDCEEHMEKAE